MHSQVWESPGEHGGRRGEGTVRDEAGEVSRGWRAREPTLHPVGDGVRGDCRLGSNKAKYAFEESQPADLHIGL